MALSSQKSTPVLVMLLAGITGYIAYTGAVIDTAGMSGLAAREERVERSTKALALGFGNASVIFDNQHIWLG